MGEEQQSAAGPKPFAIVKQKKSRWWEVRDPMASWSADHL